MPNDKVRNYVELADDEDVTEDYHVATIKKPSHGEAHFAVTNKRLIMYVWSKKILQVNSAELQDVRSTDIFWSKRQRKHLGIGIFVVGLFLSMISIISWLSNPYNSGFLLLFFFFAFPILLIGIYYIRKIRNLLAVTINVNAATGAFTFYSYSKSALKKGWNPERLELDAIPGPHATKMARELGGLLLNLQKELQS
jgi:hypothetical protein